MYKDIPSDGDLVEIYQTYTQQIYDRINQALEGVDKIFMTVDDSELDLTIPGVPYPNALNRPAYLWTIKVITQLQSNLNALVKIFNDYSLISFDTGGTTPFIKLWVPHRLVLDETYYTKLNDDFKSANNLLDRLFDYLQPYEK